MQRDKSQEMKEKAEKDDSNHGNLTPDDRDNKRRITLLRHTVGTGEDREWFEALCHLVEVGLLQHYSRDGAQGFDVMLQHVHALRVRPLLKVYRRTVTYDTITVTYDTITVTYDTITVTYDTITVTYDTITVTYDTITVTYDTITVTYDTITVTYDTITVTYDTISHL